MNIEIANRLLQLRKSNNLSQEDLATKIGISRQAVSKWERAEASPDTENLISLSRLYNISIDELLKTEDILEGNSNYTYIEDDNKIKTDALMELTYTNASARNKDYTIIEDDKSKSISISKKNKHMLLVFPYPVFITIVYLTIGFLFGLWHPGWMLYLTIPIYYCIVSNL